MSINKIVAKFYFIAVLLPFIVSCTPDKEDVQNWILQKDNESVEEFIIDNINKKNNKHVEVVQYALEEYIFTKSKGAIRFSEKLFYSPLTDLQIKRLIIKSMNKNKIGFLNSNRFIDYYLKEIEKSSNLASDEYLSQLRDAIKNLKQTDVEKRVFPKIIDLLKKDRFICASFISDSFKNITVDSIHKEILTLIYSINFYAEQKKIDYGSQNDIKIINDQIEKLEKMRNSKADSIYSILIPIKSSLSSLESDISSCENEMERLSKLIYGTSYYQLSGYVIEQISNNVYEINYGGRFHGLLYTKTFRFTEKGYFNLWTIQTGTRDVPVRGGFTQEWEVFTEFTQEDMDELESQKNSYFREKNDLIKYKQDYNTKKYKVMNYYSAIDRVNNYYNKSIDNLQQKKILLIKQYDEMLEDLKFELNKYLSMY